MYCANKGTNYHTKTKCYIKEERCNIKTSPLTKIQKKEWLDIKLKVPTSHVSTECETGEFNRK